MRARSLSNRSAMAMLPALALALLLPLGAAAANGNAGAQHEPPTKRIQLRMYEAKLRQAREAYEAQNFERAFRLTSETARWGDKWSQFALGSMYLEGKGGAQENVLLAYAWLAAAAESDVPEFVAAAERLRAAIPEQYIGQADAAGRELIDRYGLAATGVTCDKRRMTGSNRRILDCRKSHSITDEWIEVPDYSDAGDSTLAQNGRD